MVANAGGVDIRLLGPIEVSVGDRVVDVGPTQQRLVLAALAADVGRPVGVESLIDRLWDDAPDHPRRALQVYISRLRRVLDDATACAQSPVGVARRSGTYLLEVERDRVDVHRFRQLVEQARRVHCPDAERVALLGKAVELWRGVPLSDLPGQWASRVRSAWQQEYLDAVAAWANAAIQVDDPGVVLPRLTELVREYPLVESLAAALIRVLCAAGRASDALDHYGMVRQRLAEELGTDPGAELQQLYQQLLSADPALSSVARAAAPREVPRQLPAPPPVFIGRATELAELDRVDDASAVVIAAVDGMAGIGKTALAVHAAHRLADRYPDGQIFIDLHGYSQNAAPVQPGDALDRMLRALGVPGERIPPGLDERAGLYRTRLAGQRMLIVLDNAEGEEQLIPLLPGSPGCLVLVTSRRRLVGLDQTRAVSLDVLPEPDAVALFARTAGADRLADQPSTLVAETVQLCGRLPLAIRLAAARLRSHPTWTVAHLADRLREHRHRLAEFEVGPRSVTAALDLSYQQLSIDQRRTYRTLGLHPGPDIEAYATAALIDTAVESARRLLDQLLDVHLLQEPVPGRYVFHDLVRAHAIDTARAADTETADLRDTALDRLLDYYRHTAAVAMDLAFPYEHGDRPQVPPARTPIPDLLVPAAALGWLDTELPNLLAAARYAAEHSRPAHAQHLSTVLHPHLHGRGRYHDAEILHRQALASARTTGDQAGELVALLDLGDIHWLQGRHIRATDHYQQALHLAHAIGHRSYEMSALRGLGHIYTLQGRHTEAADHYQRALRLASPGRHSPSEISALRGLAEIHRLQGRYQQAADCYQQALQLARITRDHRGEVDALNGLGHIHLSQGRHQQAVDRYQQALHQARTTGNHLGELHALNGLGHIHRWQGRYQQAAVHYQLVLQMARTTGNHIGEMNALVGLGHIHRRQAQYQQAADDYQQLLAVADEGHVRKWRFEAQQGIGRLRLATGHPGAAVAHHEQALALAGEMRQPDNQARAHDGLAHAHHTLNRLEQADSHWRRALDILTNLGIDRTDDEETTTTAVRAHLATLAKRPSMR